MHKAQLAGSIMVGEHATFASATVTRSKKPVGAGSQRATEVGT